MTEESKVLTRKKRILVNGENGLTRPKTKRRLTDKDGQNSHGHNRGKRNRVKVLHLKDIKKNQRRLVKYWPELYRNGRILPLEVGMQEKMIADLAKRGIELNPKRLASALYSATNTENYCRRMLFIKHRYNLHGEPVVRITDAEREHAYQKLSKKMQSRGRTAPRYGFWKVSQRPLYQRNTEHSKK